ncbi:MAG: transglycosylase SLT domain-containing protein [Pseudomonadota bacterium]
MLNGYAGRVYRLLQIITVCGLGYASAVPVMANSLDTGMVKQRQEFMRAREAIKRNQAKSIGKLLISLKDYPLYGYLEYDLLLKRLHRADNKEIEAYLKRYEDSPISDRLRGLWLSVLANRAEWDTFLAKYREGYSTSLACYYAHALFQSDRHDEAMQIAEDLWLTGKPQPRSCDPVFASWRKNGGMTTQQILERVALAMDQGQTAVAKSLTPMLEPNQRAWVHLWENMYNSPHQYLAQANELTENPVARRIVRFGIRRLARRDLESAAAQWQKIRPQHVAADTAAEVGSVDRDVALKAVLQRHPRALEWLGQVGNPDELVRGWRIRAAILQQDWWATQHWIEALPLEERNLDKWRYWRARALEMQSQSLPVLRTAAERIYATLAGERSYYGFLSADRLGTAYELKSAPMDFSEAELTEMARRPGIARAHELYRLGLLGDARREWNFAITGLENLDLKKASMLANRWEWHDRALMTVARADNMDDLRVKYPMPFKEIVLEQSQERGIDPAWVYGVLRQESTFMPDARSHAGAMGLMQVMPQTGRLTARLLKTRLKSANELLNVNKNIQIGVGYLKQMLDTYGGHHVLATSSYNAGPHRTRQWLPAGQDALLADMWVETVPFTETRRYIRKVMTYTVVFDQRLGGNAARMRTRMPPVVPANGS